MYRINPILRFSKELTDYDPMLQKRVAHLYHQIFEGVGTDAIIDKLRATVGANTMETDGDGVFGLSGAAGLDENVPPEQAANERINDGVEAASLDDFGTALTPETPPNEDELGLGDDLGLGDGLGTDDEFGDFDVDDDLGLPGMDDEVSDDLLDESGDAAEDDDSELDSMLEPVDSV